jgi:hypothetical protein
MLSIILTWIGAVLGLSVLVATAVGGVVIDFDDAFSNRRRKSPLHESSEVPETPEPTVAPLG